MKLVNLMLLGISMLIACSCQTGREISGDFKLLPQAREMEISGISDLSLMDLKYYWKSDGINLPLGGTILKDLKASDEPLKAQVMLRIDEAMDIEAEGYLLDIMEEKVEIVGKDRAGLIYGCMTLGQLVEDASEQEVRLPLCSIRDFPELAYRAIHIDIKHHRETLEYYYQLMDDLAKYKVNAIIAEVEDKLAYERQPLIASADAISIEDWRKLSDYAMERNIEISPLIQGLGHASFVLKHDEYKPLRDDPGSDWAFNPLDPKTYELQFDLYLDALEAFPHGRYLHVGGDEVLTTGRNSGKTELELQLYWLNKVCAFANDHGRTPIFWDDMPLKYANLWSSLHDLDMGEEEAEILWAENEPILQSYLDQFPKNCVYMRWNYRAPGAISSIKAMDWFKKNGFKVMGATAGQTRWVLMPQNESNMDNIRTFTETSIDKGLESLFLTLWDDDSPHFELYKRGILAFAEYSWAGGKRSKDEVKSAYRQREFSARLSAESYAFVDRLEPMVAWWKDALLLEMDRNFLSKEENPGDRVIGVPAESAKGDWAECNEDRVEKARWAMEESREIKDVIEEMKALTLRNHYRLEVYEQVNEMVAFTAHCLLALDALDRSDGPVEENKALEEVKVLAALFSKNRAILEDVYGEIRILNKPGGYVLDQDHHHHLANQALSMDWQFLPEMILLEKIEAQYSF